MGTHLAKGPRMQSVTIALLTASLAALEPAPSSSMFIHSETSDSGRSVPTSGLFPVWEETGVLLDAHRVYLGTGQLAYGITSRVTVGVNPLRFMFRTPNLGVKVALMRTERLRIAVSSNVAWVMPGSGDVFTTSNFSTRLDARDTGVFAVPAALSATIALTPKLFAHFTLTEMLMVSAALPVQATTGASLVVDWQLLNHHAVSAHVEEVGFWRHEFAQFGASYRYQRSIFEGRIGVAYQLRPDGPRVVPAVTLGVEL